YLTVMALLWAVSMPEYLAAEDGITGHGVPIGSVWYTTACFLVAIAAVWAAWAARRTLPPHFQGAPLDVPARTAADTAPKAGSMARPTRSPRLSGASVAAHLRPPAPRSRRKMSVADGNIRNDEYDTERYRFFFRRRSGTARRTRRHRYECDDQRREQAHCTAGHTGLDRSGGHPPRRRRRDRTGGRIRPGRQHGPLVHRRPGRGAGHLRPGRERHAPG